MGAAQRGDKENKGKQSKGLKGPYSLLVESGRLVQSISSEVENANTVAVGTNVEYARRMHYGSKKGEFEILVKAHTVLSNF